MGFKVPMPCLPWAGAASASGQTMRRGGGVALGQAPPPPSQPHRKTELRDSVSWSEPATSAGLGRQTLLQWAQTDYGTSQPKMMRGLRLLPDGGAGGLQKTSASAPPLLQPSPLDSAELSLTLESSLWPCPPPATPSPRSRCGGLPQPRPVWCSLLMCHLPPPTPGPSTGWNPPVLVPAVCSADGCKFSPSPLPRLPTRPLPAPPLSIPRRALPCPAPTPAWHAPQGAASWWLSRPGKPRKGRATFGAHQVLARVEGGDRLSREWPGRQPVTWASGSSPQTTLPLVRLLVAGSWVFPSDSPFLCDPRAGRR
ncbi:formin-like protein 5 [Pteropus vampyrus]|uniref:Formin-like protein 5 n=1 Tax=Pteropus vampyrus TaxID=132908 RepID=A0A6P6BM25_PTEVA|nr:formin-like protein 5 [Pteropus vampyrus]